MNRGKPMPWLTLGIFAVTALFACLQYFLTGLVPALQRQPSLLAEQELWRLVTAWLVQGDGVMQIAVNLPTLLIVGIYVEWGYPEWVWIIAYATSGLIGEVAGIFWQPIGSGNSVAVAGLVGVALVHIARRPDWPMPVRLIWPALGLIATTGLIVGADIHGPALLMGFILGVMLYPFRKQEMVRR